MRVIACSRRSYSRDSPAWLASVSNSRTSSPVNEAVAPTRSPSTITPVSRVSPGTGATSAWRIPRASMQWASSPVACSRSSSTACCPSPTTSTSAAASVGSSGAIRTSCPRRSSAVRSGWSPEKSTISATSTRNVSLVRRSRSTSADSMSGARDKDRATP